MRKGGRVTPDEMLISLFSGLSKTMAGWGEGATFGKNIISNFQIGPGGGVSVVVYLNKCLFLFFWLLKKNA